LEIVGRIAYIPSLIACLAAVACAASANPALVNGASIYIARRAENFVLVHIGVTSVQIDDRDWNMFLNQVFPRMGPLFSSWPLSATMQCCFRTISKRKGAAKSGGKLWIIAPFGMELTPAPLSCCGK